MTTPLHTPFVTALRRTTTTDTVVVRVTDSDGVTGWGEAPQVWQVTGESLAGAEACVTGPLAAVVTGRDPDDLHAACRDVGVRGGRATTAPRPPSTWPCTTWPPGAAA